MRRRQVLQVGAALAVSPLTGCGAGAPDPKPASAIDDVGNPPPAPAASAQPIATQAPVAGDAPAVAPKEEIQKSPFSRVIAKVGKNHGHLLVVSFADVTAGAEKTYELTGSTHPHSVKISADEMKSLAAGKIVRTKTTLDRGHAHRVLAKCAPPVDPPEWVSACKVEFSGKDEHELVIPAADIAAKVEKTYDIQGVAGHAHEVTISAADFERLGKGEAFSLKSSVVDDHRHVVILYPNRSKA
jgi:hypothetical protein